MLQATTWSKIPIDILNMVSDYINIGSSSKATYAQLSLVCKSWARLFRPLLFRSLILGATGHVAFLGCVLRSQTSSWLAIHINHVTFAGSLAILQPMAVELLLCRLRHLKTLAMLCDARSERLAFPLTLSLRLGLSKLAFLTSISFLDIHFRSHSILLRLLGSCQGLESLSLTRVTWDGAPDPNRLPPHIPSLPRIQSVHASGLSQYWPLSWLLTMAAFRYCSPPRSLIGNKPAPPELSAVAHIVEILLDTDLQRALRHWTLGKGEFVAAITLVLDCNPGELLINSSLATRLTLVSVVHSTITIQTADCMHGLSINTILPPPAGSTIPQTHTPVLQAKICDIKIHTSKHWSYQAVKQMDWERIGAQLARLPSLERFTLFSERELFQDEFHTISEQLGGRLPPDTPLHIDLPNVLPYPSAVYMHPADYHDYLARNAIPGEWRPHRPSNHASQAAHAIGSARQIGPLEIGEWEVPDTYD